jgi:nucleotide-binding universal stress UspA family protein
MAIVVAVRPGHRNASPLALAGMLAATLDEPVVAVAVIVVPAGVPSPLREGMTDDDYFALIATDAFAEARAVLGEALTETVALGARSVRAGLLEALGHRGASHLVLGSAFAADGDSGPGRTHVGDVGSALLHAAEVPVVLAPAGYAAGATVPDARGAVVPAFEPIRRVTVGFGAGDGSRQALEQGALLAERADSQLRAATFFVRGGGSAAQVATQGYGAQIAAAWKQQMDGVLDGAVRALSALDLPMRFTSTDFGDGATWRDAIDAIHWFPDEILVVGSRPRGGPIRTFLGSSAAEILGASPVPVMVLPG